MKKTLATVMLMLLAGWACAQGAWPNRPVRVIVPFPAGQTTDVIARLLTQQFTDSTGQTFYVDNKAGAAAIIGTEQAKMSAADGYTLLMASSGPLAINPSLYTKLVRHPARFPADRHYRGCTSVSGREQGVSA